MKKNAFTLLELLVVIGIIGILVALATVSYSATQSAGRDSRRKQDLVAIQNALEQFYSNNVYSYPQGACTPAGEYIKGTWPEDPEGKPYLEYCSSDNYCVCAELEKLGSGNSGQVSGVVCNFSETGSKDYYCIENLQ